MLFIDASELGYMVNRRNRAFNDEDVAKIVNTYHLWKKLPSTSPQGEMPSPPAPLPQSEGKMPSPPTPLPQSEGSYKDIKGFCKSATLADIEKHNFVLTPGRYVGIPDEVDDGIAFEEKMEILTKELAMQMREGLALDEEIKLQLKKVGFALEVD